MEELKVTEILEEGMVIKNYKELCNILNEKVTDGYSKKLQLERWKGYFEYERNGNSFIITKVFESKYDSPSYLIQERHKAIMKLTKYEKLIEDLKMFVNSIDEKLEII